MTEKQKNPKTSEHSEQDPDGFQAWCKEASFDTSPHTNNTAGTSQFWCPYTTLPDHSWLCTTRNTGTINTPFPRPQAVTASNADAEEFSSPCSVCHRHVQAESMWSTSATSHPIVKDFRKLYILLTSLFFSCFSFDIICFSQIKGKKRVLWYLKRCLSSTPRTKFSFRARRPADSCIQQNT